jgi:hypothetical protein
MFKNIRKPLILLFFVCFLITCIDPFSPKLKGTQSLLVVDALLTNENRTCAVKLSRPRQLQNSERPMVSGALVTIRDNDGISTTLNEATNGVYKTDSLIFQGKTGNTYILHIKTPDGTEYESDPCTMSPVQQIDSIYFDKDQEILNNGREIQTGIKIFLDTENSSDSKYLRWIYDEYWIFRVPDPKTYDYISDSIINQVKQIKQVCWAYNKSDEILIQSTESAQGNKIQKEPILFIASNKSDRLLIQYCIEVKQLSLSKPEFEFWDHMKQINETGSDIFEKQPFSVTSNIHNINNPDETVLGYFQVSSVEQKRLYITANDLSDLNLPRYNYVCLDTTVSPWNYYPIKVSFDQVYTDFIDDGFAFVRPIYDMRGNLQYIILALPDCTDCTLRGDLKKPDFWIDLIPYKNI